jgi:hypothetical protein
MKKEIIKPFDLEAYKNGAKVKTRDGHEVRIICTDAKDKDFPIIGLVTSCDGNEDIVYYTLEGKVCTPKSTIRNEDLVIVEEAEEFWSDKEDKEAKGYFIGFESNIIYHTPTQYNHREHKYFASRKQANSALAMAMISQIMANDIEHFGGAITDEEWKEWKRKYIIYRVEDNIEVGSTCTYYNFLAFHTEAQRDLFLEKYRDLVKGYLMIYDFRKINVSLQAQEGKF